MSGSKRLEIGAAHERQWEPPKGGGLLQQWELIDSFVLRLLVPDVLTDDRLVPPDGRDEVAPRPEVLPDKVALALGERPRNVDGALALDEPDDLRHVQTSAGSRAACGRGRA